MRNDVIVKEGEFIIVKEDNNTIDKVNVDDFFDDDQDFEDEVAEAAPAEA